MLQTQSQLRFFELARQSAGGFAARSEKGPETMTWHPSWRAKNADCGVFGEIIGVTCSEKGGQNGARGAKLEAPNTKSDTNSMFESSKSKTGNSAVCSLDRIGFMR